MQKYYKILEVSKDASIEEIEANYKRLKEKYSKDRFLEGEEGNLAAKKLTELEVAYTEIINNVGVDNDDFSDKNAFSQVEQLIRSGKINEAQSRLDDITNRDAEWHYIQSVIFYKKNWHNESKKQLEIAMEMDPSNSKYTDSYAKLRQKIDNNEKAFHSGNANYQNNQEQNRQMGGSNDCFNLCAAYCCMDLMCSLCCR